MFNNEELNRVKKRALEEHIPILMDDTLEKIEEILIEERPKRILEIGTAVGYSASQFAKVTGDDCVIDSFDIVSIIGEVSEKFGVEISVDDILPENFNSVKALYALIERLKEEQ